MFKTGKRSSMISLGDNIQSSWVQNPGNLAEVQQVLSRYSKSEHPMLVKFISKSLNSSS